jgi:ferrous-iron efflux pump FieF
LRRARSSSFFAGSRTAAAAEGIGVSLVAIVATLALLAWQRYVIRAHRQHRDRDRPRPLPVGPAAQRAVVAALALDQYGGIAGADPLFGLLIAAWLGWNAWQASQKAIRQLMDHEWPRKNASASSK